MTGYALRLLEDELPPNGALARPLSAQIRMVYVVEGEATITSEGRPTARIPNSVWFGTGPCEVSSGAHRARLWRWELIIGSAGDDGLSAGERVTSAPKLHRDIRLDPNERYMMRCDRVDFPLAGIAYTHTHRGPGIRCLLRGELTVREGDREALFQPGDAWFESGPEPVYAAASSTELTSFVRVMILPRALKGKTSIRYELPEDRDKPKTQQYTRYMDEFIEL